MLAGSSRSESGCRGSKAGISSGETFQGLRTAPDFDIIVRGISPKVPVFQCLYKQVELLYSRIYGQRNSLETVGVEKILAALGVTFLSHKTTVSRVSAPIEMFMIL
jgi:hypothetical protein